MDVGSSHKYRERTEVNIAAGTGSRMVKALRVRIQNTGFFTGLRIRINLMRFRIRIPVSKILVDPDPQQCFFSGLRIRIDLIRFQIRIQHLF